MTLTYLEMKSRESRASQLFQTSTSTAELDSQGFEEIDLYDRVRVVFSFIYVTVFHTTGSSSLYSNAEFCSGAHAGCAGEHSGGGAEGTGNQEDCTIYYRSKHNIQRSSRYDC